MLIPRVFHQVWVGPDPLPQEFARYGRTWPDHHPGWELRLWTEENLPQGLRRPEAYERLRSPVERCDILRLELVWRFGGVYLDTDFECLRSIEPLIEDLDFFTAAVGKGRVNHAIIGAVPEHPILDRALEEIRPGEFRGYDKRRTGPIFFDGIVKRHPEARVFEQELFYAKATAVDERAYAVHHDANAWKDSAFRADEAARKARKAQKKARKAKAEARRWRELYEQSEAQLAEARRVLRPVLGARRLLSRLRRR